MDNAPETLIENEEKMPKNKKSQALIEFKPKIIISSIFMISSAFYIINMSQ